MIDEVGILKDGITSEKTALMLARLEHTLTPHLSLLGVRNLDLPGRVQHAMVGVGNWLFNHLFDAASAITSMILIPFIVFFLMKDGHAFKRALISLVPNRYFEFTLYLLYKLNVQFGNYLRGQLLDSLIVGTLATAALWALDIKYFLIIGAFTGLANIIPYVGPITGAALAIIVSMLQTGSLEKVLSLIAAFTVIKLIDDVIVQPLVVARTVQMHPLTVLLAVLAGGQLYGVLGMLLSVPIAGFIKVVVRESVTNYRNYGEA
jgi:putative permease